MTRAALAVTLLLLAIPACRTGQEVFTRGEVLTYAQYQTIKIEDHLTAETILDRYGRPKSVQEKDGKVQRMVYRCEDRTGKFRDLELEFDASEVLVTKRL